MSVALFPNDKVIATPSSGALNRVVRFSSATEVVTASFLDDGTTVYPASNGTIGFGDSTHNWQRIFSLWFSATDASLIGKTIFSLTSNGSRYGTVQIETTTGTGAWSLGHQAAAGETIGTPVLTWNGSGHVLLPNGVLKSRGGTYNNVNGSADGVQEIQLGYDSGNGIGFLECAHWGTQWKPLQITSASTTLMLGNTVNGSAFYCQATEMYFILSGLYKSMLGVAGYDSVDSNDYRIRFGVINDNTAANQAYGCIRFGNETPDGNNWNICSRNDSNDGSVYYNTFAQATTNLHTFRFGNVQRAAFGLIGSPADYGVLYMGVAAANPDGASFTVATKWSANDPSVYFNCYNDGTAAGKYIFRFGGTDGAYLQFDPTISDDLVLALHGNSNSTSTHRTTIDFEDNGFAAPSAADAASNGDKVILWGDVSSQKFAIGIETQAMWFQTAVAGSQTFYWYQGATPTITMSLNYNNSGDIELKLPGLNAAGSGDRVAITLAANGFAAPAAVGSNSNGDKLILWDNLSTVKAALGVESGSTLNMWYTVADTNTSSNPLHKFYNGNETATAVCRIQMGNLAGGNTYGTIWLGSVATPGVGNYALISDNSSITAVNCLTGAHVSLRVNNTELLNVYGDSVETYVPLGSAGGTVGNFGSQTGVDTVIGFDGGADVGYITAANFGTAYKQMRYFSANHAFYAGNSIAPVLAFDVTESGGNSYVVVTNAGTGATGAQIVTNHNSASPAADDDIFILTSLANDGGATQRQVGAIACRFLDVTATTMDSEWRFSVMNAVNAGNYNTTARLDSLGVWTDASSATMKTYDERKWDQIWPDLLDRIEGLDLGRYWARGLTEDQALRFHVSPTAERFHLMFGLGTDETIAPKDLASLALMGVTAMRRDVESHITSLENKIEELRRLIADEHV